MMYQKIIKPLLFRIDPERTHHLVMGGMEVTGKIPGGTTLLTGIYGTEVNPILSTEIDGIHFPNPVGLAAGLDKNGQAVKAFSSIGFGFMEVGTVTPLPQAGNEQPRLFRLPQDKALINRMGFNNVGAEEMAVNLEKVKNHQIPIAVNIGKNKVTPNEHAEDDYRKCIRQLYKHGDFFVVNISSPNTPDLRSLQHGDDLRRLLQAVIEVLQIQKNKYLDKGKPVFVKIAPDVTEDELAILVDTIAKSSVSGIIATNTTIGRDGLTNRHAKETGGLSGKPLVHQSTQVIRSIYKQTNGKIPIIGCGGIFSAEDAYEKIRAGASLVEIYTSLIYEGPGVVRKINNGLITLLKRDGFSHISQAVGIES